MNEASEITILSYVQTNKYFSIKRSANVRNWYMRAVYKVHPSPKVMADIFQTQKLTWCPHPICTIFGQCIKCMQAFIFCENILTFCINPFCTGILSVGSVIFFSNQVWTTSLIFCWNLTDSSEIFWTSNSIHFLYLTPISWRLPSR